jgi:hypothetical protein
MEKAIAIVVGIGTVMVIVCFVVGIWWYVNQTWRPSFEVPVMSFVSGTEYNIGEAGQVIVEARFANGTSALSGTCGMAIWYPDKLVFMMQNGTTGPNGNQYVNFTIPNKTGVYEYQAVCPLVTNINGTISKSFHVSEFQNFTTERLNRIRAVTAR